MSELGYDGNPEADPVVVSGLKSSENCGEAGWTVVHDFLFEFGGAELVTSTIVNGICKDSPLLYLAGCEDVARRITHNSERLLPRIVTQRNFRQLAPIYPAAIARIPEIEGNAIASSYAFAHHVRVDGRKIVYCHSPLRQVWSGRNEYRKNASALTRIALGTFSGYLRGADVAAANRATTYVATSRAVRDRIWRYYSRADIPIIAPPLHLPEPERSPDAHIRKGLLWVGRITEPYKKLSLLLDVMHQMPQERLTVIGDGPDRARLEASAPSNVEFVGWKSRESLSAYYSNSEVLVFPGEDDFGIVPVEAMACGTPVVALDAGGARDTVTPEFSGLLFNEPSITVLKNSIQSAQRMSWNYREIADHASATYGTGRFIKQMQCVMSS